MSIKAFCGGIETETNCFSPIPTGLDAFRDYLYIDSQQSVEKHVRDDLVARALKARSEEEDIDVHYGLFTAAHPGAPVPQADWETLRDELLSDLREAMPVDIVALNLHGAMMATRTDDCEGELLGQVRDIVGPDTKVGSLLDSHTNLSDAMVEAADVLVLYKENPHTDIEDRAHDLVRLLLDAANERTAPVMSVFDCRMADVFQTNREPMKSFVRKIKAMESQPPVLHITVAHGFRGGDVPFLGAKMVVITDNDKTAGDEIARKLGLELFEFRGRAFKPLTSMDSALDAAASASERPFLLADMADNPGSGGTGDSTYILAAMLQRGMDNAAVGYIWDPLAVDFALQSGEGARYRARIGGKACPLSGPPLDLDVTVERIIRDATLSFDTMTFQVGNAVYLKSDGLDIVLISQRQQALSPSLFNEMGVDLAQKQFILLKSAQHYKSKFAAIAEKDVVVAAPGVCSASGPVRPLKNLSRPLWPYVEDPFSVE